MLNQNVSLFSEKIFFKLLAETRAYINYDNKHFE